MSFADGFHSNKTINQDLEQNKSFDYESHIRTNIRKIRSNISYVEENLADLNNETASRRLTESLQSHLKDTYEIIDKTKQMFKDWTIHLASNPLDKQKKKFSFSKLLSNFDFEIRRTQQLSNNVDEAVKRVVNSTQNSIAANGLTINDSSRKFNQNVPFTNMTTHGSKDHVLSDEIEGFISESIDEPYYQDGSILEFDERENEYLIKRQINEEKLTGLTRISKQVMQAHQVFKDLAGIIVHQDEELETIESNLDHSYIQSSKAINELEKSYKYYLRRRKRKIILITISILVILVLLWMTTGLPFSLFASSKTQLKK